MANNHRFNYLWYGLLHGLSRGAWLIIAVSLALAALSVYYTVKHLTVRTSRNDLVASDQKLIARSEQVDREFGSRDSLVVVVENGKPARSIAFAEALAKELRKYPQEFPELFYRVNPEPFKHWALLYLEPAQLRQLKDKLQAHRPEMTALVADPRLSNFFQVVNAQITRSMIGHLFTSFLEEDRGEEKLPDLGLLNATLKQLYVHLGEGKPYESPLKSLFPGDLDDLSEEGYFFTENNKYLLFLVTPQEDGFATSARCLKLLREVVARVQTGSPGIQVGVTGPAALEDDEMTSALGDITLATWLSLLSQLILLIIFFRSFKRTLVEGLVLIIGLCWTFGMLTLVVGHLNLLSLVFAPLMLGLTIDYGVHWFCRLEEEQAQRGRCNAENLSCTLRRATPGIIYAALAAAISFLPLAFTGFKGLAELGLILFMGILLMLVATLALVPSLVIITERCKPGAAEADCPGNPRPFLALRWRRPGLVVALGLLVTALGGVSLFKVNFDLNPLHLQNQKTESVVWELKLLKDSRYSTSYGAMTTASLTELQSKSEALKKLTTVSHVESILSFLPGDLAAKRALIQEMAPILTEAQFTATPPAPSDPQELAGVLGRIRFKLAQALDRDWTPEEKTTQEQLQEATLYLGRLLPLLAPGPQNPAGARLAAFEQKFLTDLKGKWELLQANVQAPAPTLTDLPPDVRQRFVSPQGSYLIRVFPSQDIWNPEPLARFVQDLRSIDPEVVGDPILLHFFTLAFRNACLWAAGLALLAIAVMLLLLFRSLKMTLLALLPLVVGTGLTLNLMWLLDIPFNQANVLFLPLILGEGIEFGIIILVRWKMEDSARAITLPAGTAKGVLLAALTTTVGFGSLMVSGHQGVFSLGLLATVGSLSVLLASLSVLPAFLRLLEKHLARANPTPSILEGVRRRLGNILRRESL